MRIGWGRTTHALLEHTARLLHAAGDVQGAIARTLLDEAIALLQSGGAQPALADALALRAGLEGHG